MRTDSSERRRPPPCRAEPANHNMNSAPGGSIGRYGRRIGFWGLVAFLYASLAAGSGGIEEIVSASGPGMAMWIFLLLPFVWGLPSVLINAELASAIPVEGGYVRWVRRALGPFWGFMSGWLNWFGSVFDNVIYPVLVADYIASMWPGFAGAGSRSAVAVTLIIGFGYLNFRGIRAVALSSAILMVVVLVPWVVFSLLAFPLAAHNPFTPLVGADRTPAEGLGVALVLAMWFFSGYELPSTASEEYEKSHRNLPWALVVLLVLMSLSYLLPLAAGLMVAPDWTTWQVGSLTVVASQVGMAHGGPDLAAALGTMIALAVVVGSIALFNGLLVPYSRIPMVLAEEGDFPRLFARLHHRYRTPWFSILFNCTLYVLLHRFDFSHLVLLSMWNGIIVYLLVDLTLLVLRYREPDLDRPFRIPGGTTGLAAVVVPLVVVSGWALWQSLREIWNEDSFQLLVILFFGLVSGPVYYFLRTLYKRRRSAFPVPGS